MLLSEAPLLLQPGRKEGFYCEGCARVSTVVAPSFLCVCCRRQGWLGASVDRSDTLGPVAGQARFGRTMGAARLGAPARGRMYKNMSDRFGALATCASISGLPLSLFFVSF